MHELCPKRGDKASLCTPSHAGRGDQLPAQQGWEVTEPRPLLPEGWTSVGKALGQSRSGSMSIHTRCSIPKEMAGLGPRIPPRDANTGAAAGSPSGCDRLSPRSSPAPAAASRSPAAASRSPAGPRPPGPAGCWPRPPGRSSGPPRRRGRASPVSLARAGRPRGRAMASACWEEGAGC